MDTILQIVKDYATVVNSLLLIVLLIKYASDIRKQRLEYKKLEHELKALRERDAKAVQKVLTPTDEELKRYIIDL